ncbi:hypothetical protein IEN91_05050 [Bacillus velezensis]|uniref:hypothetical protein n=1 Tax=Bacillus velezensis TaxID=492670 RepID=UPI0018C6A989|nr:hypothetical protein [Bacillus velezensis]QPK89808.1 hypothetical protein IEN91_05050 [Bacillus velezensis]
MGDRDSWWKINHNKDKLMEMEKRVIDDSTIEMITFEVDNYYEITPEEELKEWSEGIGREDVISIRRNEDKSITVFYWS